jgi:hypothetical protein
MQNLPLMPTKVTDERAETKRVWQRYQFVRAKPIPPMYSWFDERPDEELIRRIETARARAEEEGRSFGYETSRVIKRR